MAAAAAAQEARICAIRYELAHRYDEPIWSLDTARSIALHLVGAAKGARSSHLRYAPRSRCMRPHAWQPIALTNKVKIAATKSLQRT